MIFLNDEELTTLTGKTQKNARIKALQKMNVVFEKNAIGEILVSRSYIERRFSGESQEAAATESPNYGCLAKYGKKARHTKSSVLAPQSVAVQSQGR